MANESEARLQDLNPIDQLNDDDNLAVEHNGKACRMAAKKLIRFLITACDKLGILGVHVGTDMPSETQNVWINTGTDPNLLRAFKDLDDRYLQPFKVSGSVCRCEPVEGYPLDIVSKVRSADPIDTINLYVAGRNLTDNTATELFNCTSKTNGNVMDVTKSGNPNAYSYVRTSNIFLKAGQYTFGVLTESTVAGSAPKITIVSGNGAVIDLIEQAGSKKKTFTVPTDGLYFLRFYPDNAHPGKDGDMTAFKNIQLEAGPDATAYNKYTEPSFFPLKLPYTVTAVNINWQDWQIITGSGINKLPGLPPVISARAGTNTIWTDISDTEVSGRLAPVGASMLDEGDDL